MCRSEIVDQVCSRFQATWDAEPLPPLEDFLKEVPEALRPELLRELLRIDIENRRSSGQVSRVTDCVPPAQELPAKVLGDYEILARLGGGGMGIVYKACHRRLQRIVALKILRPEYAEQPEAFRRFLREMEAAGRLDHENLARITDAREEQGIPFLVMEYVEGEDLAKMLVRRGSLPVDEACGIVRQTASALQHAHQHNLVHRDIKPSNLMLTPEGQVKVLDLGLARLRDRPNEDLTVAGRVVGTIDYISPEQAQGRSDVDIRADLYSLGCTFYHLLAGSPPYTRPDYPSYTAKLLAHVRVPFPSLRAARPDVPEPVEAILRRLIAKDPADRFATPAELAAAVAPYCPDATASTLTWAPATVRAEGRFPRLFISVVLALLLLALASWWIRPKIPGGTTPGPPSPVSAEPVSVVSATVWIRRAGDDASIRRLRLDQANSGEMVFPALAPDDDFKLAVEFSRPTDWCLVWFSTRGVVSLVAQSDAPQSAANYPADDYLVGVDPAAPPGCHLLVLLASNRPVEEVGDEILAELADLAPPTPPDERYVQLRGPGAVSPSGARLDPAFSEQLQQRLPRGVYWIHQLSLPTVR